MAHGTSRGNLASPVPGLSLGFRAVCITKAAKTNSWFLRSLETFQPRLSDPVIYYNIEHFWLNEAGIRGYPEASDMLCLRSRIAERSHGAQRNVRSGATAFGE
jgi:hypothetical protein